jgi:ribosomal protein S18 acetylase RimI-like enzyme
MADALASAFYDDPFWRWLLRRDGRREAQLRRSFAGFIRLLYLPRGECYVTDPVVATACWLPPATWHVSLGQQARLTPTMVGAIGRELPRLLRTLAVIEKNHPDDLHWYLPFIGVAAGSQGQGLGSTLLRHQLRRCDAERLPAYLEASSERNRVLYERHDFEVVEEVTVADSPPLWRMWRRPQTAS